MRHRYLLYIVLLYIDKIIKSLEELNQNQNFLMLTELMDFDRI